MRFTGFIVKMEKKFVSRISVLREFLRIRVVWLGYNVRFIAEVCKNGSACLFLILSFTINRVESV